MIRNRTFLVLVAFWLLRPALNLQSHARGSASAPPKTHLALVTPVKVCARCVRAHMDFLASDALRGRGSGTQDEWIAATYVGSQLEQYGVEPAGDSGGFIQRATVLKRKLTAPPRLKFQDPGPPAQEITWTHGNEILALYLGDTHFSGPLKKIDRAKGKKQKVERGSVVFVTGPEEDLSPAAFQIGLQGAAVVIIPESERLRERREAIGTKLPELPLEVKGAEGEHGLGDKFSVLAVAGDAEGALDRLPDGTLITMEASAGAPETNHTWNAVGKIAGTDPAERHEVVLLTAHLDHLGIGTAVKGDDIYNGADDDASGTTAVLELARVLAGRARPRRTVIFALFGSEEVGGLGATYFREHPPVPLKDVAAYLEFEMIGRPDPAVPEGTLWLTGWSRSNLGPELAAHGAHIVADPHPKESFFQRSDNYLFAEKGVVAQTVSSYGLHGDYHQPSDDLSHIDFKHMDEAIDALLKPILWLVNSNFVPHWNAGGRP